MAKGSTLVKGGGFPFKVRGKYVALRVNKVDVTKGGIHIPDSQQEKEVGETASAEVLGVGDAVEGLYVGDTVYVAGAVRVAKAKIGDHEFVLAMEEDIALVYSPAD